MIGGKGARRKSGHRALDDLAQRIEPASDVSLPDPGKEILQQVVAHVRRKPVTDKGYKALKNTSLLLSGKSCAEKGMAVEVLANELGRELYRVDLGLLVSKYIGETEKNLRKLFDAAELSGAILFFDEADSLFGKRSEVRDAHDRYANLEMGYLLRRMEKYPGLVVVAGNLESNLDSAFMRRFYFVIRFPLSEYQALPDLDAGTTNAVVIQTIKLEHEGWERDEAVGEPTES